ncbi:hypothetical protein N7541_011907 [Penicillium brevicompactum]|uniref:Uncharacterized protein n=1 Tax=Penicillium brevicompactum TaxID=5074 RepID=A0A9W9UIU9_PENBR|nr:hypothetical protein N7541_011907 [Penicillium brevicompactum]
MAEERARRAKEMTEEAINEAEVAMKANRELTAKVVDLQAGFQALTDEEILREFTTLHHDVVQWSFSHFQSPTTPDGDTLGSSQGGDTLDLIAVRLGLSTSIYNEVLKHHIVGEGSAESAYLRDVDMEVQKQCSTRTAHHWRGATSMVAFSLNRGKMEAMVIDLVNQMEETFGHRSHTASKRRTHQLRGLIWRCIDLKQKLEVQYDTYIFLSTSREMPFDEFRMLSSSEINARNSKVVCSLWPGLVKLSSTGDTFVVEKELVMTDHEECVVWESESTEYAGLL